MIYFTSDLHFYHEKIIMHCQRPFKNAVMMNEVLIRNWNAIVRPEDSVYILGDVTMKGAAYAFACLSQLTGKKYLIRGNHDEFVDSNEWQPYAWLFGWVKDYAEVTWGGERFVLCHYPFVEWNQMYKGAIDLHGHQHNKPAYNRSQYELGIRRYDVGVDANGFRPVSAKEILANITDKIPTRGE